MTYQLFPTTPFIRPHAGEPGDFNAPRYVQLSDGRVVAIATQRFRPDPDEPYENHLIAHHFDTEGNFTHTQLLSDSIRQPTEGTPVELTALAGGGFALAFRPDGSDNLELRSYDDSGALAGSHVVSAPPRPTFIANGIERSPETFSGGSSNTLTALEDGGMALTFTGFHAGLLAQYSGASARFTQVFDAEAAPVSDPTQIQSWVTSRPFQAHIPDTISPTGSAPLPDGGYVVVMRAGENTPGGAEGSELNVAAQLFNADGSARGQAFPVASADNHGASVPYVETLQDGSFVIAWTFGVRGEDDRAYWRRYDAEGEPMTEAVQVAPGEGSFDGSGTRPLVTVNPTEDGGFFIVGQRSGDGEARYLQRYDAEGQPIGGLDTTLRAFAEDHFSRILGSPIKVFDMGEAGWLQLMATAGWNDEGAERVLLSDGFSARMHAPDILGTAGDDVLEAGDTGMALFGFDGDDTLIGGAGNDFFVPGPGDDVIIGGGGTNLARFGGEQRDYEVLRGPDDTLIVTDLRDEGPNDGTNTLSDIELLQFSGRFGVPLETVGIDDLELDIALSGTVSDAQGDALDNVAITFTPSEEGWDAPATETGPEGAFGLTLAKGLAGTVSAERPYDPDADGRPTAGDALDVLRMAVGLNPSFGPAQAQNFIAADMNGDGQVTAADALEIL
ncbi:MAG: dockerin type I domain-containing protein, partial [Pararhodobacter sp.]